MLLSGICPRVLGERRLQGRAVGASVRRYAPLTELRQRGLSAPAEVCVPLGGMAPTGVGSRVPAVLGTR